VLTIVFSNSPIPVDLQLSLLLIACSINALNDGWRLTPSDSILLHVQPTQRPQLPQQAPSTVNHVPISRIASPAQRTPTPPSVQQPIPPPQTYTAPPQPAAPHLATFSQPQRTETPPNRATAPAFPPAQPPAASQPSQQFTRPPAPALPPQLNGVISGGVRQIPAQVCIGSPLN
jgi:hypothetical protein